MLEKPSLLAFVMEELADWKGWRLRARREYALLGKVLSGHLHLLTFKFKVLALVAAGDAAWDTGCHERRLPFLTLILCLLFYLRSQMLGLLLFTIREHIRLLGCRCQLGC